jgi:hypothetical protein
MKRFYLIIFVITIFAALQVDAGVFDKVLRKGARIADDVPVRGADDLVKSMSRSKAARKAMESSAKRIVKSADPSIFENAVKAELRGADPSLVRFADTLDKPSKEYLLILGQGAKTCNKNIPDMVSRAKFLERGGSETVAAVGMYGDDLARSAMRVDSVIHSGKLISPAGMKTVTTADFGKLFTKYGDSAHHFWTKYVMPHWEKWLVGGALAWYLIDPEGFMDTAGMLTQEGVKRLTQCAGDITAKVIEGVSQGVEHAIEKVADASGNAVIRTGSAVVASFFTGFKGIAALVFIILIIGLALPYTRYFLLKPFAFLFKKP